MFSISNLAKQVTFAALTTIIVASCGVRNSSDNPSPAPLPKKGISGVWVLNEGGFGRNNASLSLYNLKDSSFVQDYFEPETGRKLGDVANDLYRYGGKIYIAVNNSSTVEIISADSGKDLRQISLLNGTVKRQPRSIVGFGPNVFVCNYDSTIAVIDTTTLNISRYLKAGRNPEGLAVVGNQLYVCNSGGLAWPPNFDSTLSVFNLTTFEKVQTYKVEINLQRIVAVSNNEVLISTSGNYNDRKPKIIRFNGTIANQIEINNSNLQKFSTPSGDVYMALVKPEGETKYKLARINPTTLALDYTNLPDISAVTTPYGFTYDPSTEEYWVSDAKNYSEEGDIYYYGKDLKLKRKITAGLLPAKLLINR